jgi:hypothetical protein
MQRADDEDGEVFNQTNQRESKKTTLEGFGVLWAMKQI